MFLRSAIVGNEIESAHIGAAGLNFYINTLLFVQLLFIFFDLFRGLLCFRVRFCNMI